MKVKRHLSKREPYGESVIGESPRFLRLLTTKSYRYSMALAILSHSTEISSILVDPM